MWTCDIEWLVAVEGNKPGDRQQNVAHDELMDKWAGMGLLRITRTTRPGAPGPSGSKAQWRAFLESRGVQVHPRATKAQMMGQWHGAD